MSARPAVELAGQARGLVLPKVLVVLGLLGIVWLSWLPHRRAERMAESESLATEMLRLLLKAVVAATEKPSEKPTGQDADPHVDGRALAELVTAAGGARLESCPPPGDAVGPAWAFTSHEYCFLVLRAPKDVEVDPKYKPASARARLPFEGYAYPRSTWSYGRSVFFRAEDRPSAFTRNLHAGYVGTPDGDAPNAGAGRPRPGTSDSEGDYEGNDNGRWLIVPMTDAAALSAASRNRTRRPLGPR